MKGGIGLTLLQAFCFGLALSSDAFSASLFLGTVGIDLFRRLSMSLLVGLFHVFFPLFGFYLGIYSEVFLLKLGLYPHFIHEMTSTIGAGLFMVLGGIIIKEVRSKEKSWILYSWWNLSLISLGVSLDALTTGFGLGMLHKYPSYVLLIGSLASLAVYLGLYIGDRIGRGLGLLSGYIGGALLFLLGIFYLIF